MIDPVRKPGSGARRHRGWPRYIGGLAVTCIAVIVVGAGLAAAFFPGLVDALMLFDVNAATAW